ncbi:MAG: gliding motility-associated ABC transporter ATP-binding subunit GldA [Bacteroidota bacterium]
MSLEAHQLTKTYGKQKALDNVSFTAEKGKITGFLGPNGAGKSTTMKIATGYLSATSGAVKIAGIDVAQHPEKVKRKIGYLPEHNPLYMEMYVKEYLHFVASAYQLPQKKEQVEDVVEVVGLSREKKKKIGTLSKGYRQRVGLAQALIHDPEVLILDEPTSGLDPNQLVEIRNVIKQVSEEKTVIFSTHIMQEVEALCDRVVIIDKGKIIADDKVQNLKSLQEEKTVYEVEFENEIVVAPLKQAGLSVQILEDNRYLISATDEDPRKKVMKLVGEYDLPLLSIGKKEASLEDVFQSLTSKADRKS